MGKVFISYSHNDEKWKDELTDHLGVLGKEGLLEIWDDRQIAVGDRWRKEIEKSLESANVGLLLVTAKFLNSNFILEEEVPRLLERRQKEGVRVIPLIVRPCAWELIEWLNPIQVRPKDARPLSTMKVYQRDTALAILAEEIYKLSKEPGDVGGENGMAEVLKAQNRLGQALELYKKIIAEHPEDVVAKTGMAEVLKAQNQLGPALELYKKIIAEHPEDVFAKNGMAEVLKAQNQLGQALELYKKIIAEHPENVVAKNGMAEVLKAQNQLGQALELYEQIIAEHPEDVVAKTGMAEVLKAQNQLGQALELYEQIIAEHPEDVVAKNGMACVLAALERWDDALAMLPTGNVVTRSDWIAYHIRGMILLRKGNLDDAISIFEQGVRDNPRPLDKDYFRSALAVAYLGRGKPEKVCELLDDITAPALQDSVNVLRLDAFGLREAA